MNTNRIVAGCVITHKRLQFQIIFFDNIFTKFLNSVKTFLENSIGFFNNDPLDLIMLTV